MVHSVLDLSADHSVSRGWLGQQGYGCVLFPLSVSLLLPPRPLSFSPDIFSSVSVPPSLKVCLDLSAEYLILSDVQRKVTYSGASGQSQYLQGSRGVGHIHSPHSH